MDAQTKSAALTALSRHLRETLASVAASQGAVQAGAIHEETRAESEKDTRATEASYLARGLAERTEALRNAVALLEAFTPPPDDGSVRVGALVALETRDGTTGHYLIAPVGGGVQVEVGGTPLTVLTPNAPLARALLGGEEGDEIQVPGPGAAKHAVITSVA